jgi:predicted kinase
LTLLVVLAGRPGVGKTTVARLLSQRLGAMYLRIDTVEQALIRAGGSDPGSAGYEVAFALAADNLALGVSVVADAVNALQVTRAAWVRVASQEGCACHLVELVCSDGAEHRRRLVSRTADMAGHVLPGWEAASQRPFEPMADACCIIDTAVLLPEQAVAAIIAALGLGHGPGDAGPPAEG